MDFVNELGSFCYRTPDIFSTGLLRVLYAFSRREPVEDPYRSRLEPVWNQVTEDHWNRYRFGVKIWLIHSKPAGLPCHCAKCWQTESFDEGFHRNSSSFLVPEHLMLKKC
ncbi:hypothetical protein D3C87_186050 [compost metagenome]